MTRKSRRKRFLRREPGQARSRALVESIVIAFEQMLETFGDERDITIERLVERAGVSIGSFYEYFTNRDALLGVLVERATRDNFEALRSIAESGDDPDLPAAVNRIAAAVAEMYLARPLRTRMLISGIGRLGLMRIVIAERDRCVAELARIVLPFRPDVPAAEMTATMLFAADAVMGAVSAELYRKPRPPAVVAGELAALTLAVIASRHPHGI